MPNELRRVEFLCVLVCHCLPAVHCSEGLLCLFRVRSLNIGFQARRPPFVQYRRDDAVLAVVLRERRKLHTEPCRLHWENRLSFSPRRAWKRRIEPSGKISARVHMSLPVCVCTLRVLFRQTFFSLAVRASTFCIFPVECQNEQLDFRFRGAHLPQNSMIAVVWSW